MAILKRLYHILTVFFVFTLLISSQTVSSQTVEAKRAQDSTKVSKKDTIPIKTKGRSDFKSSVKYHAKDSIRFDIPNSIIRLYGNASVDYEDMNIKAEQIEIDYKNNIVNASGAPDSSGKIIGKPIFNQGGTNYETDKMSYNFKSQKGLILGVVTKQGEGYVQGEKIKKSPTNELYIDHATYTTCNQKHPHFAFHATKIKVIPGERIISSAGNLGLGAIPTPLVFPFGFFPFPLKRSSGILMPGFSESTASGFYLEHLGFYWAANPYMGITTKWDVYSNGGFITNNLVEYYKKYSYRGNFNFIYSELKEGFGAAIKPTKPTGEIIWTHTPMTKGTGRFTANVHMGLNSFNRTTSKDAVAYSNNTFSSNVSYSKSFAGTPFNLTINARQSQNVATRAFDADLANMSFNMSQVRPFQNSPGKSTAWYRTINIAYNSNFKNYYNNTTNGYTSPIQGVKLHGWTNSDGSIDSSLVFSKQRIDSSLTHTFEQTNMGLQQSIPINASLKLLKYFSLNPAVNLNMTTYLRELEYKWLNYDNVTVRYNNRVNSVYSYNATINLTTNIYGSLLFKGRIQAIRHLLQPTIGFAFAPDYSTSQYYTKNPNPTNNSTETKPDIYLSKYGSSGFIFGGPTSGKSNLLTFNLKNSLEMKVKTKKDTTQKFKKVSLIDNFNINGNYNFGARGDSNQLSIINTTIGTNILKILNINFTASLDPYLYKATSYNSIGEVTGQSITKQYVAGSKKWYNIAHVNSMNLSLSMNLNPKARKKQAEQFSPEMLDYFRRYPNQRYVDFSIPWSATASFNYSYNQIGLLKASETTVLSTTSDFKITSNWRFGITNLGYDFSKELIVTPQVSIIRDLHCWIMTFNWSPYSPYQTYTFNINVKASSLQDLKIPKRGSVY